jgi:hypothetical protein
MVQRATQEALLRQWIRRDDAESHPQSYSQRTPEPPRRPLTTRAPAPVRLDAWDSLDPNLRGGSFNVGNRLSRLTPDPCSILQAQMPRNRRLCGASPGKIRSQNESSTSRGKWLAVEAEQTHKLGESLTIFLHTF